MAVLFGAYICWAIGMIIYSRATAEKRKEQEEREKAREAAERPFREKAFFDGCVQADILLVGQMNDWLSNTAKTAIEIAKKCRLIPANSDRTEQNLHMLRDVFYAQSETEEGKQAILEEHRENDKAEWEKGSSCSDLPPEAKLQTMLHNWEQELLGMPSPQLIRPAKTSDGMVQAGMAAGIGGAIPALVSLSHTAERNAQIEEYNKGIKTMNLLATEAMLMNERTLARVREAAKRYTGKKIARMTKEEVLALLEFKETKVEFYNSETGTLKVETAVKLSKWLEIDGAKYFVDGSLVAEIYKGKEKIGEAIMVFPVYGLRNSFNYRQVFPHERKDNKDHFVYLKGLCLFCKDTSWEEVNKYQVKIVPGKYLWAMESLTPFEENQIGTAI